MKEVKLEESWDKRKIIIASVALLLLIAAVIYFTGAYKIKSDTSETSLEKSVKGVTEKINAPTVKDAVQDKIEEIREEASNINIVEVASSSPQVQKVINDIKALENYPSDQAKGMCEKLCDSL